MACPYFLPSKRLVGGLWPHPGRLPLGGGFSGTCIASSQDAPIEDALLSDCNLGYAHACPHLPRERAWDAVRFSVACGPDGRLLVRYICELAHRPIEHGRLEFDGTLGAWRVQHPHRGIQRMAECYVESCLLKMRKE